MSVNQRLTFVLNLLISKLELSWASLVKQVLLRLTSFIVDDLS